MPSHADELYVSLNIEQEYPDDCDGWWDFWRFYGRFGKDNQEIVESWENWVGQDDPYPCQDEWEYL